MNPRNPRNPPSLKNTIHKAPSSNQMTDFLLLAVRTVFFITRPLFFLVRFLTSILFLVAAPLLHLGRCALSACSYFLHLVAKFEVCRSFSSLLPLPLLPYHHRRTCPAGLDPLHPLGPRGQAHMKRRPSQAKRNRQLSRTAYS